VLLYCITYNYMLLDVIMCYYVLLCIVESNQVLLGGISVIVRY